ncbi:sulfotransferase [Priestia flexa]|uniref:sulfotransferase family protein n=1 Tax=Priestia flexa TaxID=86664 RepID=UPI000C24417A|nr:sulfotransferase [Priestia flexa]MEC0665837.1 sulfotransferase [Priestia flexa]
MSKEVQPIFVLGSTRSGTTLIGNYVGSSPDVCDLGEYFSFYFSYDFLVEEHRRIPSYFKTQYLQSLQEHAASFANSITIQHGLSRYCDSTPWNLMVAKQLADKFPNAIFILCLRHYSGVIQSYERSFKDGYLWAGENFKERAELYSKFYSNVSYLPKETTIPISYDALCLNPKETIAQLTDKLNELGIKGFDEKSLTISHATNVLHQRPTIAKFDVNNNIQFSSISSYDSNLWNEDIEKIVYPVVEETDQLLHSLFPEVYQKPAGYPAYKFNTLTSS